MALLRKIDVSSWPSRRSRRRRILSEIEGLSDASA
jgi:hypothetical protein